MRGKWAAMLNGEMGSDSIFKLQFSSKWAFQKIESDPISRSCDRMLGEELAHPGNDLLVRVLDHVVAGVGNPVDFRLREPLLPFGEKIRCEAPVLLAPDD